MEQIFESWNMRYSAVTMVATTAPEDFASERPQ